MDARTVAALDVIAPFAAPNPGCSAQGSRFFRVWWLDELASPSGSPSLLWIGQYYLDRSFRPPAVCHLSSRIGNAVTYVTNFTNRRVQFCEKVGTFDDEPLSESAMLTGTKVNAGCRDTCGDDVGVMTITSPSDIHLLLLSLNCGIELCHALLRILLRRLPEAV